MLKHYLRIYSQIFLFHLKSKIEYRFNFLLQLFYGPAYVFVMFLVLQLVYFQTPTLAGWTKAEGMMLFATLQLVYSTCIMIFIGGFRHFLWEGIRTGELDTYLTKPISPHFMVAFSRPNIDQIALVGALVWLFFYQLRQILPLITLSSGIFFSLSISLSFLIIYLTLSTYATLGFYVTKAAQIIELFDKSSDFAQYPTTIFPPAIQVVTLTVIPIALFGSFPVAILLNKLPPSLLLFELVFVGLLIILQKKAWQTAMKKYTSASS